MSEMKYIYSCQPCSSRLVLQQQLRVGYLVGTGRVVLQRPLFDT